MATGAVQWFNAEKGFGSISPDDNVPDVLAHFRQTAASGYRCLEENQWIEIDAVQRQKGLQAETIRPGKDLQRVCQINGGSGLACG